MGIDLRTRKGREQKQKIKEEAIQLRQMGLSEIKISEILQVTKQVIHNLLPLNLNNLNSHELYVARKSIETNVPKDLVSKKRKKEVELNKTVHDEKWFSIKYPKRLDSIEGKYISCSENNDTNPQYYLEQNLLDEIVGNLSISDINRMSDDELEPLRYRLIQEGFYPNKPQIEERRRLQSPDRHRGYAVPSLGKHSSKIHSKHSSRKLSSELMKGKHPSRKKKNQKDYYR